LPRQTYAHVAIEAFTGETLDAGDVVKFINSPENAILLQHDVHQDYDKRFAWGIEAVYGAEDEVGPRSRLTTRSLML
jgi:hypothetical protein